MGAPTLPELIHRARKDSLMLAIDQQSLQLDVQIAVEPAFDFLSAEYRAFHNLRRATVFQAPLWLDSIHRKLVPHLSATQYTLTIRNRHDRALLAVIPLVVQKSAGLSILQPADFGVCDYNCIVGDARVLETLAGDQSILRRIDALLGVAGVLIFRKIRDDGFDAGRLFRGTTATPCENAAYHSEIGTDFEAWQRRTISRKFSKELGRLGRQIAREFGPYEHRRAETETEIREAMAFLRASRRGKFEDDLLDHDVYFSFYCDYAVAAAKSGEAITYVSYLSGKPVAVLFGLAGADEFHAVLIGCDVDHYGKFSVGTQIIYRVIKLRFEQGFARIDMGLGNTGYKSHFRVDQTTLHNFTSSRSLAGSAVSFIYHRTKPLKNALKKYVPQLR
jgi:CelD/BcsL family acetyltransferase involved in cellulose biosynthesis